MTSNKEAKGIIATVAFANGLVHELGQSPKDEFVARSTELTPLISFEFGELVLTLIALGTAVEIFFGVLWMYEYGKFFGIIAFALAFMAGAWTIYTRITGLFLYAGALLIVVLAPDYGL